MVNDRILSRFSDSPPINWKDGKDRAIKGGPLYEIDDVNALIDDADKIRTVTRKCINDTQSLGLDNESLKELVRGALRHGRYINSVWCRISEKTIAACDAYEITRIEFIPATRKEMDFKYYLKFAVNNQGKLLLMVSCHLSK